MVFFGILRSRQGQTRLDSAHCGNCRFCTTKAPVEFVAQKMTSSTISYQSCISYRIIPKLMKCWQELYKKKQLLKLRATNKLNLCTRRPGPEQVRFRLLRRVYFNPIPGYDLDVHGFLDQVSHLKTVT